MATCTPHARGGSATLVRMRLQSRMRLAVIVLAAALLASACTTPLPQPPPAGAGAVIDDIRGSWRGTWGGAPVSLLIANQLVSAGYSGLYVGTYQILGHERPGVDGILTSQIDGAQTSVRAYGWFGGLEGQLVLRLFADSPSGQQRLTLRPDGPDRFVGMGESSFRRGPSGPIELVRAR